jgi:hypothetical protein
MLGGSTSAEIHPLENPNPRPVTKIRTGVKQPEGTSYCCSCWGWLGPCCPEKGTARWWQFYKTAGWRTSQVKCECWSQSHLNSYWTRWRSLVVRDNVLLCYWQSGGRSSKRVQIIFPRARWRKYWGSSMENFWKDI